MSLKIKKLSQPLNETWKKKDLNQKYIPANKKTTVVAGFEDYFVRVVEEKNEILDMDLIIIKMIVKEIIKKMNLNLITEEEKHLTKLLETTFRSVRQSTLQLIINGNDWDLDKKIRKLHGDFLKIDSKDLKSEDPGKRIIANFKYYEKKFEKRNVIQNYNWKFNHLNEDIKTFIRHNERAKLNLTDFSNTRWKGRKCAKCQNPCCQFGNQICSYCSETEKIRIFSEICKFFNMLGDMYTFYYYLPDDTFNFYNENEKFTEIFTKEVPFNCIKLYALFWNVVKQNKSEIDEKVKKMKIIKPFLLMKKRHIPNYIIEQLNGIKIEEKKDDDIDAINGKKLAE